MYKKQQYVFKDGRPVMATIRTYTEEDFIGLIEVQRESFPPPFPPDLLWNEQQLQNHIALYPEGAICVEIDGEIAGSMTGMLTKFDPAHPTHKWEQMTDSGSIGTHDPEGESLYVVDIGIKPKFRKLKLGKLLMEAMYERVVADRLERLIGGGRMPGYHRYANELSAEQYIERVLAGELRDPVISFLLSCGRMPVNLMPGYLDDEESHDYALLMEWKNPFIH
ncbi:GNAT family N-acetyltransferase [Planococcus sp. CP5-4]|uniref:GNAT family N-acetyltransferase n=1 Tax=unclassified Planococcus (in: firmicutes) TaxID=2662419 RepID=UPI001C2146F4|nr:MULTISPECIES: GNAT family N-acetyltransferase [unclassified Planococcus (in: firmicutes)]MBU9674534.1 GNAT family N-acetyltransferase [Planococcus sp. CP5-4_YE]MBV0910274.1 GNAT family N-acetyltransferase [Planococcus sp. CP5-4_UN]MBW6065125.1 GNAT family N-acetyltransferase [Planococcus sp. CP5-4]